MAAHSSVQPDIISITRYKKQTKVRMNKDGLKSFEPPLKRGRGRPKREIPLVIFALVTVCNCDDIIIRLLSRLVRLL